MSQNETRRVDSTGYTHVRDPRLTAAATPPDRRGLQARQLPGTAPTAEPDDWDDEPDAVAEAPAKAAPAEPVEPGVVVLSRTYMAQGKPIQSVKFRKPSTRDLRMCGYPMRNVVGPDGRVVAIEELPDVVGKYLSILSTPMLPPSTVNEMDIEDFASCSGVVLGFFLG